MQQGVPLTAEESEAVAATAGKPNKFAQNQTELAAALGVSRMTILIWSKQGAPRHNPNGQYEIAAWQKWVRDNGKNEKATSARSGKGGGIAQIKLQATARKLQLQNEKLEAEIGILKRDYLKRDEVETEIAQLIVGARTVGEQMPAALAPQLAGLDIPQIEIRLRQWWDEYCEKLHRGAAVDDV